MFYLLIYLYIGKIPEKFRKNSEIFPAFHVFRKSYNPSHNTQRSRTAEINASGVALGSVVMSAWLF